MITINLILLWKILSLICLGIFMIILVAGMSTAKHISSFIVTFIMILIPFLYIAVERYVQF